MKSYTKQYLIALALVLCLVATTIWFTIHIILPTLKPDIIKIVTTSEQMKDCIEQGGAYEIDHNEYHKYAPEYEENCTVPQKELWKNEIKVN